MNATVRQLRMIWALSHQRGFDEPTLRQWITAASGQPSLRRLTVGEASQLIDGLQHPAWDLEAFQSLLTQRADRMTAVQERFIARLAAVIGWSEPQVTGLARRMYHRSRRESLTRAQASGLIEALKAIHRRPRQLHNVAPLKHAA